MEVNIMIKLDYKTYRQIPGFHNYLISEDGDVYSKPRKKFIAVALNWAGYKVVTITDDNGFRAPRKVHRLVYRTYIGPFEDGKVIDHKDNNKLNNHYSNLQQITPSENSSKSFISGKNKEKVVWTKLMIHEICKMMEENVPEQDIFESLGIDYDKNRYNCNHLIGDLRRGTIHSDVTSQYDLSKYIPAINKKDVKLSIHQVKELYIRLLFGDDTISDLSRIFHIGYSSICKIRDKKTWKQLTDEIDEKFGINRKVTSSETIPWIVWNFLDNQQEYGDKLMVVGEIPLNGNGGSEIIRVI